MSWWPIIFKPTIIPNNSRKIVWTEGEGKKSRIGLGYLDAKSYKILVSYPATNEPNLVAYHGPDDTIYFTDADKKTVKKVKPTQGIVVVVAQAEREIKKLFVRNGKVYWMTSSNEVS